jgi:hypothetical protein
MKSITASDLEDLISKWKTKIRTLQKLQKTHERLGLGGACIEDQGRIQSLNACINQLSELIKENQ